MAQHTSRQRLHLLTCQAYLDAMKSQGIENTITRQATNPATFAKPRKIDQLDGVEKRKTTQKLLDFPVAVRIQALALAEASISYDRIREITGIDAKLLEKMRKTARERGYDVAKSMQMKEDYVTDPLNTGQAKPKKHRSDSPLGHGTVQAPPTRSIPAYVQANTSNLPPGNWNFMTTSQMPRGTSLG